MRPQQGCIQKQQYPDPETVANLSVHIWSDSNGLMPTRLTFFNDIFYRRLWLSGFRRTELNQEDFATSQEQILMNFNY